MELIDVARGLADCLPVNDLTDVQLSELLAQAKLRRFERDGVIYHRGSTATPAAATTTAMRTA